MVKTSSSTGCNTHTSPIPTDKINNRSSVFMKSKQKMVNNRITEIKRSERLFRKRSFLNKSVIKDDLDNPNQSNNSNKRKSTKSSCYNETKSKKLSIQSDCAKKLNNNISVPEISVKNNLNNRGFSKVSNCTIVDNKATNVFTRNSLKTLKNKTSQKSISATINTPMAHLNVTKNNKMVPHELEENDDSFVFTRKRGRPSKKKVKLQNLDNVVNTCHDKIDHQKSKNLSSIIKKLQNANKSMVLKKIGDNVDNNINKKSHQITKKFNEKKLSVNVENETEKSYSMEAICKPEEVESIVSSKTASSVELLSDANDQQLNIIDDFGTLEHDICLLSKRLMIPSKMVKSMVVDNSLSTFREKYSKSITPSMLTVSPIITDDFVNNLKHDEKSSSNGDLDDKYKIEPIRESIAYEKTNLIDLMNELSKTMPSWSLSIVSDPPRYVISQMSIDMYGTPIASKSIVLDKKFRASVYINQCLQYKYCKYYTTVVEIIKLIKVLNNIVS